MVGVWDIVHPAQEDVKMPKHSYYYYFAKCVNVACLAMPGKGDNNNRNCNKISVQRVAPDDVLSFICSFKGELNINMLHALIKVVFL